MCMIVDVNASINVFCSRHYQKRAISDSNVGINGGKSYGIVITVSGQNTIICMCICYFI